MKQLFSAVAFTTLLLAAVNVKAQDDKSKRPSPPAMVSSKIASGATVSIDYSQPSVKGRTIGKDLEPKEGEVWRTGANEATVFETDKAVKINGASLPAGKYALFSVVNKGEWTFLFNKTWKQWGAFDYKKADDVLSIKGKAAKAATPAEKMTFTISKEGDIHLLWGDNDASFSVK